MLRLVIGAIRRRRSQALLLFLLGAVAATVAAAAPHYVASGVQSLAASSVEAAVPGERVVAVGATLPFDKTGADGPSGQVETFRRNVARSMVLPGFRTVVDARTVGLLYRSASDTSLSVTMAYRDGVCAEVAIDGRCPTAAREIAVGGAVASSLNLRVGETVLFGNQKDSKPVPLVVTGIFRARAPYEPYWGRSVATAQAPVPGERLPPSLAITPLSTFDGLGLATGSVSEDLIATGDAFRTNDAQVLIGAVQAGTAALEPLKYGTEWRLKDLTDRIWDDQQLVYVGVPVGVIELLLLCWFAIFLAVRQTGEERRLDVAKLKLHGARRRDMWVLVTGQSIVPVIAGGVIGLLAGATVVGLLTGPVAGDRLVMWLRLGSAAAAALAVLGGALAALLAERRILGESVADLGREIGSGWGGAGRRRHGWRASLFDIGVGVLAVAATYQLRTGDLAGTRFRGLAVAAAPLLALVAGLVASRIVPLIARAVGPGLLAGGRVGAWLVSVHLARRAARSRVLALLTLALAVLASTMLTWGVSAPARANRAAYEVGADRVLIVDAANRSVLIDAVRAVDPAGRFAMAAVQTYGPLRTLVVDTTRLGAVVPWRAAYGVDSWSSVASELRRPHPDPISVAGDGPLRLTASWQPTLGTTGGGPAVAAQFLTGTGSVATVTFGPLRTGTADYQADAPGCSASAPCRLISFGLVPAGSAAKPPMPGSTVLLSGLAQASTPVVTMDVFADRTRWRNDLRPNFGFGELTTRPDGLALAVPVPNEDDPPTALLAATAYVYDTAVPLPILVTGTIPAIGQLGDNAVPVFGDSPAPVVAVARARLFPRLGDSGVLADLTEADRLLPTGSTVGTMEVWAGPDAPADLVDRLAAHGVTVVSADDEATRVAQLDAQGTVVTQRFLLFVGLAGAVLALISFGAWAVAERRLRGRELVAMRTQGLPRRTTRTVAVGGYVVLALVGVAAGFGVGIALRTVDSAAVFLDGFTALADPPPTPSFALLAAGACAVALVGVAVLAGTGALTRTRSARRRPGSGQPGSGQPGSGQPGSGQPGSGSTQRGDG